jgi:hypothetical protein
MAKPKLALIPAAQGSKFYSVLPSDGVGDFDFTRGSSATRINAQGLIETVADTSSRLNYDLLNGKVVNCPHYLLEPASTNIFQYSEDFSNSYWNTSRIETTYIADTISPDGTLNAYTLEMSSGQSNGGGVFKTGISISGDNSFSVFAKKKTANYLVLSDTGTTSNAVYFDLQNGIVGTTYNATGEIKDFGNGWYRCTMKYTLTSSGAKFIYLSNLDGSTTGTVQGGDSIYIFGAQLEQSSYPTSYIPTNGTAITRAAESANGSGNASTFNDSEGVLMLEGSFVDDTSFKGISISNGSNSNNIRIYHSITDNQLVFRVTLNSVDQVLKLYTLNDTSLYNKISFKYKENDFNVFINGFKLLTDDSGSTFASGILNQLNFNRGDGLDPFYGNTRELQYFDSALTDAQLETLTSWTSLQEMITSQLYTNY